MFRAGNTVFNVKLFFEGSIYTISVINDESLPIFIMAMCNKGFRQVHLLRNEFLITDITITKNIKK